MRSRFISKGSRTAIALAVSLILAFMPFSVNLNDYMVTLERNKAHAIAPVFVGASAFIAEMATAAGFASTGDFVATIVGMTAVGSGMVIANDAGVYYGQNASQNINSLIASADYPDWDTLTPEEQENWVSEENYNSAKLNTLVGAYGLDDAYTRYKSAWGAGGNGNFSFSSSEETTLDMIGQIGSNWANGLANDISDVLSVLDNDADEVFDSYAGVSTYTEFDGSNISGYPYAFPTTVKVNKGITQRTIGNYWDGNNSYFNCKATAEVYWVSISYYRNSQNYGGMQVGVFSKNGFGYGSINNTSDVQPSTSWNGTSIYNGHTFALITDTAQFYNQSSPPTSTLESSGNFNSYIDEDSWAKLADAILYGDEELDFSNMQQMPGYPQNVVNNINIYFPTGGINENTDWDDLITEPEEPEEPEPVLPDSILGWLQKIDSDINSGFGNFNFYNNGDLKVHDLGVFTELSDIYTLLMEISSKIVPNDVIDAPDLIGDFDFDELDNKVPDLLDTISDLAPFGSILLLSEMYSIMANYTQIESPELVFPFDFGGFDDQNHELVIDLSWLDDIKPLINFLCIAMLVIAIANATIRIVEIEAAS